MTAPRLDPTFAAALREVLVDEVTAPAHTHIRGRRRTIAAVAVALTLGVLGGTAYALTVLLPGGTRPTALAQPVTVLRTGTSTLDLGPRPEGTTSVWTELTCISPGSFEYPDGAGMTCSAEDIAGNPGHPTHYLVPLAPGQRHLIITASAGATWRLEATYVRAKTTKWEVNAKGETYGVVNKNGEPDLIAVLATNGRQGYIYGRDMNTANPLPSSPEQAAKARENVGKTFTVPVYESDGEAVIGEFVLGG